MVAPGSPPLELAALAAHLETWCDAWQEDPQAFAAGMLTRVRDTGWPDPDALVHRLGVCLAPLQWQVATAESCTGGGIAQALTAVPGSSAWVAGGLVTYSNAAKQSLLAVPADLIAAHGAVSLPVAIAMAEGARAALQVALAVSATGVAGPGGGSPAKPVGTVCMAWAVAGQPALAHSLWFPGDRASVRRATVWVALVGLLACVRRYGTCTR